jgi:hypothetical protein
VDETMNLLYARYVVMTMCALVQCYVRSLFSKINSHFGYACVCTMVAYVFLRFFLLMYLCFHRYGRTVMEQKLKELFGEDMHEIGIQGGEITYTQFLKSVERVQVNMFLETNKGRKARKAFREYEANSKKK